MVSLASSKRQASRPTSLKRHHLRRGRHAQRNAERAVSEKKKKGVSTADLQTTGKRIAQSRVKRILEEKEEEKDWQAKTLEEDKLALRHLRAAVRLGRAGLRRLQSVGRKFAISTSPGKLRQRSADQVMLASTRMLIPNLSEVAWLKLCWHQRSWSAPCSKGV